LQFRHFLVHCLQVFLGLFQAPVHLRQVLPRCLHLCGRCSFSFLEALEAYWQWFLLGCLCARVLCFPGELLGRV
jgi:hypothetical protein